MAYYYSPFRNGYKKDSGDTCALCAPRIIKAQLIRQGGRPIKNDSYYWLVNAFPKFEGHTMLVPRRHITHIGEETRKEILDREALLIKATRALREIFPRAGFEIFLQTGSGSESSVPHLHWHVVPASPNDPLRSFDKLGQFYTIEPGKERALIFPVKIKRSPKQLLTALAKAVKKPKRRR